MAFGRHVGESLLIIEGVPAKSRSIERRTIRFRGDPLTTHEDDCFAVLNRPRLECDTPIGMPAKTH